jgi:hypothetical protein
LTTIRALVVGHRSHHGAVGGPVSAGRQADDRSVVGDDRAELVGRRARHREGQPGVVGPGVEVEEPRHEVVGAERRHVRQRLLLRDLAVPFPDAPTARQVVQPQRGGVRASHGLGHDAVTAEEGDEERERCPRGEVALLDEGGLQTAAGGVEGDARSGDSAAHHQHVERLVAEASQRIGAAKGVH